MLLFYHNCKFKKKYIRQLIELFYSIFNPFLSGIRPVSMYFNIEHLIAVDNINLIQIIIQTRSSHSCSHHFQCISTLLLNISCCMLKRDRLVHPSEKHVYTLPYSVIPWFHYNYYHKLTN